MSHHVVVGAGIAGVSAAVAMRNHGFDGDITVIDADSHLPYERPPLSKGDDGSLRPIMDQAGYDKHRITLRRGVRVDHLDTERRRVVLADGEEIGADSALLATGVRPRTASFEGHEAANVHSLHGADQAERMWAGLGQGGPLVVVGGGFIGMEIAAVARERGLDVTVVETTAMPMLAALGPSAAQLMVDLHIQRGVRLITDNSVRSIDHAAGRSAVQLDDGVVLEAASILVACGVQPNDELARDAGIDCENGIVVDDFGRSSHPWLWAAGDVAKYIHPYLGRPARIEHWDVALRHGTAVGASMVGHLEHNDAVPYFWSDHYGKTLQMYGRGRFDDEVIMRSDADHESFVEFRLQSGRLSAVAGLNEPKAVRAARALIEAGARIDPDLLAEPATDLRALVRKHTRPASTVA